MVVIFVFLSVAAGIWGLLALHLADDPILPLNYRTYAKQLQEYVDVLSKVVVDESSSISISKSVSTHPLTSAVEMLLSVAEDIEIEAKKLRKEEAAANGGDVRRVLRLRSLNDRLMLAERGFLDEDGLPGNRWFKHLIYGPCDDPGSKLGFFPGITDAIAAAAAAAALSTNSEEVNKEAAAAAAIQHQIWRAARAIQRASDVLRGELF